MQAGLQKLLDAVQVYMPDTETLNVTLVQTKREESPWGKQADAIVPSSATTQNSCSLALTPSRAAARSAVSSKAITWPRPAFDNRLIESWLPGMLMCVGATFALAFKS